MSINNREDANKYYKIINDLVDEYTEKHKIRPSNLKRYLKPGSDRFNKFIDRNKLSEIKGIKTILADVIDDRFNMESDGVIKFESFKINETNEFKIESISKCFSKGIEKADIKMEKILADYYDTNLSSIDIDNADKHKFIINDWSDDKKSVFIYQKEELDLIISNIIDFLYQEMNLKDINLSDILKVDLSNLIDEKQFKLLISKKFTYQFNLDIVSKCLKSKFKAKIDNYYIWEV